MTLKRSVLSMFLILAMLLAIPVSVSRNARADRLGSITNITIDSNGIMKWDAIPNASYYSISIKNSTIFAHEPKFALYDSMCEHGLASGTYTIGVTGVDNNNDTYTGSTKYNFTSPNSKLPSVTNIRISGNNLTWDFNKSAVPGATPGFDIMVDGPDGLESFYTKRNYIPKSAFARTGTNDYTVWIQVQCKGYVNSDKVSKKFTGVTASLPKVTGFKYAHDILSWDSIPGADTYSVQIEFYESSKNKRVYQTVTHSNYCSIGSEIAYLDKFSSRTLDNNTSYDMKLTIYAEVRPDGEGGNHYRISEPVEYNCVYKYEEYPLKIYGERVSSKMNIRDLLGHGEVEYDPDANALIFNGKSIKGETSEYQVKDFTMFSADGDLSVKGKAEINGFGTVFMAGGTLKFETSSSINAHSGMYPVVKAGIVAIKQGGNHTFTSDYNTFEISQNLVLLNNVTYLKIQSSKDYRAAVKVSKGGRIVIPKSLGIVTPEGGIVSDDHRSILNKDGKDASEVVIVPVTPTATPVPTAKPTSKPTPTTAPTAKPSAKPTAAATATPAVTAAATPTGSASKPTGKVTTTPKPTGSVADPTGKVTATPNPTVAPTGKVTTAPKPTTADSSSDPNAQILAFVERIYIYVLDREPEAEGSAYWSDELYAFRRTGAEVAQGFIFSDEFIARNTSDEEFVTILYKTFFGRDPEEDGMNFWLDQLATGTMDRVAVANGFIYSQEWADTCASYGIRSGGDLKPSGSIKPTDLTYAFVERMYTTCMGRGYDEEGKEYWAGELANFNVTGEQCGAAFFLSAEMENYGLSDEEFLNRLYLTFMDREADSDGAAYWLDLMASGTPRTDVVFGFTRSPEFTDKCVEARILPY